MTDLVKRLAKVFNPAFDKMPKAVQDHCVNDVASQVLPIVTDDMRAWPFEYGLDRHEWLVWKKLLDAYCKDRGID